MSVSSVSAEVTGPQADPETRRYNGAFRALKERHRWVQREKRRLIFASLPPFVYCLRAMF